MLGEKETAIQLKNISKVFGEGDSAVRALTDVSLKIEAGKFVAIVGKSGSGKSTLMNIIGALDQPTQGEVIADGMNLTELNADKLAEYRNRRIGYIFQSFYLEPSFTVMENVAMPLTIAGMKKSERIEAANKVIKDLELTDKAKKKASQLSGGQKQRVAIARALVREPSIILADEPTGNLDSHNGAAVMRLLQKIANSGKTVVLVTHNIEDARKTDMMVELKDGRIERVTFISPEEKAAALRTTDYDEQGNLKVSNSGGKETE